MNKLLDRYLHAVRSRLSASLTEAQRDDIVRELSDNLQSQIEDREAALGCPLNDEDHARLLEAHGHPIAVARRYLPTRPLIGPELLPFYWFTMKIAMWIAVAIYIALESVRPFVTGRIPESSFGGWIAAALMLFGAVTLTFMLLEFWRVRFGLQARWNPRHLPPVSTYSHAKPRNRHLAELLGGALALGILSAAVHPAIAGIAISSEVWTPYRIALIEVTAAGALIAGVRALRPNLVWATAGGLLVRAASVIVLYQFSQVGDVLIRTNPNVTAHTLDLANRIASANLLLFFWTSALDFCVELWRVIGPLIGRRLHGVPSRA